MHSIVLGEKRQAVELICQNSPLEGCGERTGPAGLQGPAWWEREHLHETCIHLYCRHSYHLGSCFFVGAQNCLLGVHQVVAAAFYIPSACHGFRQRLELQLTPIKNFVIFVSS